MMTNNFAVDLRNLGQFSGALTLDEENVRLWRQRYGERHWHTSFAQCNNALDLYYLGRYQHAADLLHDAIPHMVAHLGTSNPDVLWPMRFYSVVFLALGRVPEAVQLSQQALQRHRAATSDRHPSTLAMEMSAANTLSVDDPGGAHDLACRALSLYHTVYGDQHPATVAALINTAIIERRHGRHADAARHNRHAFDASRRGLGRNHWVTLCAQIGLATDQAMAGDHRSACRLSKDAYDRSVAARGADHPYTLASAINLVHDLDGAGDPETASQLRSRVTTALTLTNSSDRGSEERLLRTLRNGERAECPVELPPY
jgi:Tetratricopeptide repeat